MNKKAARSRRLRKKLFEGEFSVFGFVIDFTIEDGVEDHFDAFMGCQNISAKCYMDCL